MAVQWLNEALCFVSSFVVAESFVLRNRHLRQAAKRYWLPKKQALQKNLPLLPEKTYLQNDRQMGKRKVSILEPVAEAVADIAL
ncbi:MAG: hypothetical protein SGI96_06940 [Bacteroidota bacterium]|nr:hypothetical protein [Bacteroidota bacterium]